MNESHPEHERPSRGRSEAARLAVVFGLVYFVQGVGEPTEGLIAQPVRSMLDTWGHSAAQITAFSGLLSIPWSLKPLYGLLTDFVPLAGYRRKSYLVLTSLATMLSLGYLYVMPPAPGSYSWLLACLLVPTVGVAFSDVVIDGLMVEKGQPLGLTGRLQSVQWGAMYTATILTGSLGGFLSEYKLQDVGFLICAVLAGVTLAVALSIREAPGAQVEPVGRAAIRLVKAIRTPGILAVGAFLFLWTFNPFSSALLQSHMTGAMGLSEQFYGHTVSVQAIGSVTACVAYGFYCRRVAFTVLVHTSIVLGIASTLAYWALFDARWAMPIAAAVGFTYMSATLIQLDLAARICPPLMAGTVFALLMALSNLSMSLSIALGGQLYDRWTVSWGPTMAFNALVGVGAAFTACCWLLAPWLKRAAL